MIKKAIFIMILLHFLTLTGGSAQSDQKSDFRSDWPKDVVRTWVGPEYWANRLQDWRIANGRLECLVSAPNRCVHVLTRQLGVHKGEFKMSVHFGLLNKESSSSAKNRVGFRIGAQGEFNDYRDSAIYGKGLDAGITATGKLFIGA